MVHIEPLRPHAPAPVRPPFKRLSSDDSNHDGTYCNGVAHIHVQEPLHRYSGFPLALTESPCDCVA